MFDLTTLDELLATAQCAAAGRLLWRDEVSSTSDVVASLEDYHGVVCLAGLQTQGRGRRGQQWRAPFGSSVLMSIGWRMEREQLGGLSLACGLAVDQALRSHGVNGVSLKWPNDILLGDRKLGGILIELSGRRCIVGVGLNVRIGDDEQPGSGAQYPGETRTPWTDLREAGYEVDLTAFAATLVVSLCAVLDKFNRCGFAGYRLAWQDRHCFHGQNVILIGEREQFEGVVRGVDESGGLEIEMNNTRRVFYSGEVSLVPAMRGLSE